MIYDCRTLDQKVQQAMNKGFATDARIKQLVAEHNMISPFVAEQVKSDGIISYGLSSFGYDMRVANEFKIFTPSTGELTVVDPKRYDPKSMVDFTGDVCIIPPNSFALARSVEYWRIPRHCVCLCLGKSTYARTGIITNFTPFEPGWKGHVTIEISNTTPLPAKIYANEGIAQVLIFEGEQPEISYADRRGKYQAQTGITTARIIGEVMP
jgi:dCTP deaminase